MGLPDPRSPDLASGNWGSSGLLTKWWALFLRNDALFSTASIRQPLFVRHCTKHEAEMNAPALGSSVQCISLITALWALCINKHNTTNTITEWPWGAYTLDVKSYTLTLCP